MLFEGILIILIGLVLSAFFSGMETGVISINRMRLHHLVREGQRRALIIEAFLRDSNRLLGTTLIGNNLCLVLVSTLTASLAVKYAGEAGRLVAGTLMGLVVLLFCEYLPKSWFRGRPLDRTLPFAVQLRFFWRLFRPLIWLLSLTTHWRKKNRGLLHSGGFITREHLQHIARDSERWGHLTALERVMIDRVLRLQNRTARRIMTPLDKMITVDRRDSLSCFHEKVRRHGFIRMPVRDHVSGEFVGMLNLFYLAGRVLDPEKTRVDAYMRRPLFVPANMRADDILPVLRRHRQPMALVRDDKGQVLGLVTTEDVLQQITGSIPAALAKN